MSVYLDKVRAQIKKLEEILNSNEGLYNKDFLVEQLTSLKRKEEILVLGDKDPAFADAKRTIIKISEEFNEINTKNPIKRFKAFVKRRKSLKNTSKYGHYDAHTSSAKESYDLLNKLRKIEDKNRCLRVRMLDKLSAKLLKWSKDVSLIADKIHSPCVIKIGDKK